LDAELIGYVDTAGERVQLESEIGWVSALLSEASAGELREGRAPNASITVRVESRREPFDVSGAALLTRGAWTAGGQVVVENVLSTGFDMRAGVSESAADFTFRWRPNASAMLAARALPARHLLLARCALLQYPVLWWAGSRGRVPLHAVACRLPAGVALLSGPGGVGKTTLVLRRLAEGGVATGDNLSVGDGAGVWGVLEPLRVEGAGGRRMTHGRGEMAMPSRVRHLVPELLVVIRRGGAERSHLLPSDREAGLRSLVTSTYMAGELRRYWAFAATLAAGTGRGPAHPDLDEVAGSFASRLPCFELVLGPTKHAPLPEFTTLEAAG
jgi:hypothetical protein